MSQPLWLNGNTPPVKDEKHQWLASQWEATPSKTCRTCGITEETSAFIRADRKHVDGGPYIYTDAAGRRIESLIRLDTCPVYIGDTNGAVAETKQRLRTVTGRVDDVETHVESIEERVSRLEGENVTLRIEQQRLQTELDSKTVDLTAFVRWLAERVASVNAGQSQSERIVLPESLQPMLPTTVTRKLEQVEIEDADYVPISTRRSDQ